MNLSICIRVFGTSGGIPCATPPDIPGETLWEAPGETPEGKLREALGETRREILWRVPGRTLGISGWILAKVV